jgi:hypothetical protein
MCSGAWGLREGAMYGYIERGRVCFIQEIRLRMFLLLVGGICGSWQLVLNRMFEVSHVPDLYARFAKSEETGRKHAGSLALTSINMCEMSKMSVTDGR